MGYGSHLSNAAAPAVSSFVFGVSSFLLANAKHETRNGC
jgi:hypothetical protein